MEFLIGKATAKQVAGWLEDEVRSRPLGDDWRLDTVRTLRTGSGHHVIAIYVQLKRSANRRRGFIEAEEWGIGKVGEVRLVINVRQTTPAHCRVRIESAMPDEFTNHIADRLKKTFRAQELTNSTHPQRTDTAQETQSETAQRPDLSAVPATSIGDEGAAPSSSADQLIDTDIGTSGAVGEDSMAPSVPVQQSEEPAYSQENEGGKATAEHNGKPDQTTTGSPQPEWLPRKERTLKRWKDAWREIKKRIRWQERMYSKGEIDQPEPTYADLSDHLNQTIHWRPSEKTIGRIIWAGEHNFLD